MSQKGENIELQSPLNASFSQTAPSPPVSISPGSLPSLSKPDTKITVNEGILLTGGNSLYQLLLCIVLSFPFIAKSLFILSIINFLLDAQFVCLNRDTSPSTEYYCTENEACNADKIDWHISTTDPYLTWTIEFALVCERAYLAIVILAIYFLGTMIGCIIFGMLADGKKLGRKWMLLCAVFGMICGFFVVLFSSTAYVLIFALGICGVFVPGVQIIVRILMLEFVPRRHLDFYSMYLSFLSEGGAVMISAALIFCEVPWRYTMILIMVIMAVYLLFFLFVSESPRFLFSKSLFQEAKLVLKKMSRVNRKNIKIEDCTFVTELEVEEEERKYAVKEGFESENVKLRRQIFKINRRRREGRQILFQERFTRFHIIILGIVLMCTSFVYYGTYLSESNVSAKMYTTKIITGCAGFLGALFGGILSHFLGRKRIISISLMLSALCSILFYFDGITEHIYAKYSLFFLIRTFIITAYATIYIYIFELFPSSFKSTSYGAILLFDRIGMLASLLPKALQFHACILYGVLNTFASMLICLLSETYREPVRERSALQDLETEKRISIIDMGALEVLNLGRSSSIPTLN